MVPAVSYQRHSAGRWLRHQDNPTRLIVHQCILTIDKHTVCQRANHKTEVARSHSVNNRAN